MLRDIQTDTQGMEKWRHGQKNVEGGWQPKPGDDRRLEGRDQEQRANHQLLNGAPFSLRPGPAVAGGLPIPWGEPQAHLRPW